MNGPDGMIATLIVLCNPIRGMRSIMSETRATDQFRLANLRVTVIAIEGRSVCGLSVGDYFEVTESSKVRIPNGKHFCLFALSSVLPLLPAKMRAFDGADWLSQDNLVACPDPEERLIMRIERIGEAMLRTADLT
jgi:uncharacterized repeat protein (TIGR04076 family)